MRYEPLRHPGDDDEGPLELEPEEEMPRRRRHPPPSSGDVTCPNCGQIRADPHDLVCVHCGYDMKSLKVVRTRTGEVEAPDEEEEEESEEPSAGPPLSDGRGPSWLPWAVLAPAALVMVVAYLAGARGVFPAIEPVRPGTDPDPIAFAARMVGLGRFLVQVVLLSACGLAALGALAWMLGRRLGDPVRAALRVTALLVGLRVLSLLDLDWRAGEWMLETALQCVAFVGAGFVLFGLSAREVVTWGLLIVAAFLGFWTMSWLGTWAFA